jgi:hypothetical protein
MESENRIYTIKELAMDLKVCARTISRLLVAGLPYFRVGRAIRIPIKVIDGVPQIKCHLPVNALRAA